MEYIFDRITDIKRKIDSADSVALFLDYDGTLVKFAERPEQALPTQEVIGLLKELVRYPQLKPFIVSGRTLSELKRMLPVKGLSFIGLHGLEMEYLGKDFLWEGEKEIEPIISCIKEETFKKFGGEEKIIIEDKIYTLSFHYRMLERKKVEETKEEFIKIVKKYNRGNLALLSGAEVLEVRPKGWNKGDAVSLLLKNLPASIPIYIGDDTTDEDAFRILKEGITILVSERIRKSYARFYLKDTAEALKFLNFLKEVVDEKKPL